MNYRYIPFYMQGSPIAGMYYGQYTMMQDSDIDYIKEMYPSTFANIQELVEEESDRQEFAGSMMFDEYPDKLSIMRIVNRIFERVKLEENSCTPGDANCIQYPDDQWLKDIIMVLLLNEMYRRRQRKGYY